MRILDTSAITTTNKMPLKAGSLVHVQLSYQEMIMSLAKALVGDNFSATIPYRLTGLINTAGAVSAGAIYYQGEVFQVDAFSLPSPAIANLDLSFYTAVEADPVTFTDGVPRDVHQIRKIKFLTTSTTPFSPSFAFGDLKNVGYVPYTITNAIPSPTLKFDKPGRYFRSFNVTGETALTINLDGAGAKDGTEVLFVFQSNNVAVNFTHTNVAGTSAFAGNVMGLGASANSVTITVGGTNYFVFRYRCYVDTVFGINKVSLEIVENT